MSIIFNRLFYKYSQICFMETLIINIPDDKSMLVKRVLRFRSECPLLFMKLNLSSLFLKTKIK